MRPHHYQFSHKILAEFAHRDATKLLSELSGPLGEGFLFHLWEQHGKTHTEQVSAVGLKVYGVDERNGDRFAIIAMPQPENDGESLFAAIVHRPGSTRYYVFDRSASAPKQATLARLEPHGARINMGQYAPTADALLAALVQESSGSYSSPPPPVRLVRACLHPHRSRRLAKARVAGVDSFLSWAEAALALFL